MSGNRGRRKLVITSSEPAVTIPSAVLNGLNDSSRVDCICYHLWTKPLIYFLLPISTRVNREAIASACLIIYSATNWKCPAVTPAVPQMGNRVINTCIVEDLPTDNNYLYILI